MASFPSYDAVLRAGGFRAAPPSPATARRDAEVAAEAACRRCGRVGLAYRAYSRPDAYHPLTICPACGDAARLRADDRPPGRWCRPARATPWRRVSQTRVIETVGAVVPCRPCRS